MFLFIFSFSIILNISRVNWRYFFTLALYSRLFFSFVTRTKALTVHAALTWSFSMKDSYLFWYDSFIIISLSRHSLAFIGIKISNLSGRKVSTFLKFLNHINIFRVLVNRLKMSKRAVCSR